MFRHKAAAAWWEARNEKSHISLGQFYAYRDAFLQVRLVWLDERINYTGEQD